MPDSGIALTVAGMSALVSVTSLVYTSAVARKDKANERRRENEANAFNYGEPLLRAAYELASRLYNIGAQQFLATFMVHGTGQEPEYARESTLFVIAQYFAWVEIVRRDVQYLSPNDARREASLVRRLDRVRHTFGSTELTEPTLRMFRVQQRALGELMMERPDGDHLWSCMGYAQFHARLAQADFSHWFEPLNQALDALSLDYERHRSRLVAVQQTLLDVIAEMDPRGERVSLEQRTALH